MSNFWRSLNLSLVNCETEYGLSWSKDCVMLEIARSDPVGGANPVLAIETTSVTFKITIAKLCR